MLRFRELDARAREALLSMLESLSPAPAAESTAGLARSPEKLLEEIGDLLARAGPLESPLAHFTARLTESGEIAFFLTRRVSRVVDEPASCPVEGALAIVRRAGPATFRLARAADSLFRDVDSLLPTPDTSRNG